MMTKAQLSTLIALAALLWWGQLYWRGVPFDFENVAPYSAVVTGLGVFIFMFDKWFWSWRIFRPWLCDRPNISGTWEVELISDYVVPETGIKVPPKTCYMRIYQTYSDISMRLMTDESSSEIVSISISKSTADGYRVIGVYINEPKLLIHERSPIHYGGLVLTIQGTPPSSLEGSYWTTRKTRGEMKLSKRETKIFDDFKSAQAAFIAYRENKNERLQQQDAVANR